MQFSGSVLLERWPIILALCLSASSFSAQTQSAEPQAPSGPMSALQTGTILVEATVTDKKGNYISDLTPQDFRVWEDDKEQPVKSVSVANSAPDTADKARYTVLLFDNFNVVGVD